MLKLSINTDVFKRYTIEHALDLVVQAGYRFVTLNAVPFWDPHLDFSQPNAELRAGQVARLLEARELQLISAEIATNLSAWDTMERAQSVAYCRRAIDLLAPSGCRIVSVSGGGTNLYQKGEQQANLQESLRLLSLHAQAADMIITVDIYPGSCLEDTPEVIRIIDELALPNVRYMLCTPHVASLGEDLVETYRLVGRHLGHLILADTPLSTVTHSHLVPGEGNINFVPLLAALQRDSYSGYMTVQIYTHMDSEPLASATRARHAVEALYAQAMIQSNRIEYAQDSKNA